MSSIRMLSEQMPRFARLAHAVRTARAGDGRDRVALDELRAEHESHLQRATAGWSEGDLATLAELFGRLLDDLTATLPGLPAASDPPRETR